MRACAGLLSCGFGAHPVPPRNGWERKYSSVFSAAPGGAPGPRSRAGVGLWCVTARGPRAGSRSPSFLFSQLFPPCPQGYSVLPWAPGSVFDETFRRRQAAGASREQEMAAGLHSWAVCPFFTPHAPPPPLRSLTLGRRLGLWTISRSTGEALHRAGGGGDLGSLCWEGGGCPSLQPGA